MLLDLRLLPVLLLIASFNVRQESATPQLSPELSSFSWMLGGHWELERVWTAEAEHEPYRLASPIKTSIQITVGDSGELLFNYEYVIITRDPLSADFGAVKEKTHFRHSDRLAIRNGRLVVSGFVVRKQADGSEDTKRYNVATSSSLSDRILRDARFDLMQHVSLATKIYARRVDTLGNLEYRPFTPATPVASVDDH